MSPSVPAVVLAVSLLAAVSGCSLTGPNTITTGRPLYNLAVQRTTSEQMLLNLVRLRYRDRPLWLEVASVSTSFEIESDAGVEMRLPSGDNAIWDFGVGGRVMEIPTVTYTPLQGEQFVRQIMTPIDLRDLVLLYHSGWAIDRIFRICVQEMNDVPNAPSASGPTPERAPVFTEFKAAMHQLRELQKRGEIDLGAEGEQGGQLVLWVSPEALDSAEWTEFSRIMSLPRDQNRFVIDVHVRRGEREDISALTRSMASVLFFLSQGVEVPPEDEAAGRVTVTRGAAGGRFEWAELSGDLLRIHSSPTEPVNAAVRTRYRGSWFYIDDSDLDSKSTFTLLGQLGNLQAGDVPSTAPLLTLPVGR